MAKQNSEKRNSSPEGMRYTGSTVSWSPNNAYRIDYYSPDPSVNKCYTTPTRFSKWIGGKVRGARRQQAQTAYERLSETPYTFDRLYNDIVENACFNNNCNYDDLTYDEKENLNSKVREELGLDENYKPKSQPSEAVWKFISDRPGRY